MIHGPVCIYVSAGPYSLGENCHLHGLRPSMGMIQKKPISFHMNEIVLFHSGGLHHVSTKTWWRTHSLETYVIVTLGNELVIICTPIRFLSQCFVVTNNPLSIMLTKFRHKSDIFWRQSSWICCLHRWHQYGSGREKCAYFVKHLSVFVANESKCIHIRFHIPITHFVV